MALVSRLPWVARVAPISLILLLTVSAASPLPPVTSTAQLDTGNAPAWHVWILGDSLTEGLYASSEGTAFRNDLFNMLRASEAVRPMETFWHRGCTLARLEMRWPEFAGQPDLLFLEYGINDLGNPGCPQIPEDEYQARYGAMLDRILADAPDVQVVVGTIPWCGWTRGSDQRTRVERYNSWIIEEAQRRGLAVADLWGATLDRPGLLSSPAESSPFPPGYAGDSFHPNDAGHLAIAETFYHAYRDHYATDITFPGVGALP